MSTNDAGLCRCCRSINQCRVINVEYEFQGQKEVYSDMLMDCFGLMLSDLDGTAEAERLICTTCILRLRDACGFRMQVLLCEEKLLQANIQIHQNYESKFEIEVKPEVIVEEIKSDAETNTYALDDGQSNSDHVDDAERRPLLDISEPQENIPVSNTTLKQDQTSPKQKDIKSKVRSRRKTNTEASKRRVERTQRPRKILKVVEHDIYPKFEIQVISERIKEEISKPDADSNTEANITDDDEHTDANRHDDETPKTQKPTVRLKCLSRDGKMSHNCATIVENSYVCPFETEYSDYHCIYCKEIFTDPKDLRAHTETHDPKKYKELVRFNRRNPQVDVLRIDCRLCDAKIEDLTNFKSHITTVHNKYLFPIENEVLQFKLTSSPLACMECDSTFGYFHALRNHMAVHFGTCICDICGVHFFKERRLNDHKKIHRKKPELTFSCKECGKEFRSKQGMDLHVTTTHKKEATYQCAKCDDVFLSYALRYRHRIEVHGEKREFACEHCDKSYDNRKSLREHNRRAHLKISKHKCDVCDRMFYLPCQLKEHMTTHTGERNFRCEYCGKSYPRLRALRLHMKSHSENKYRCAVCDATFTQNASLRNHVKKQHQNLEESSKLRL